MPAKDKSYVSTTPNPRQNWNANGVLNKEFAATNTEFREACYAVKIEPTVRQASKWRMKKGLAYTSKYKTKSE